MANLNNEWWCKFFDKRCEEIYSQCKDGKCYECEHKIIKYETSYNYNCEFYNDK